MPNRSNLPTIYTPSTLEWQIQPSKTAFPLELFDITHLHFHNTLELGYCVQGNGICYVDGIEYPFHAGDVQVIFPFQKHLSKSIGEESCLWHWVNIEPLHLFADWGMSKIDEIKNVLENEMAFCGIFTEQEHPEINALVRKILLMNHGVIENVAHRMAQLNAALYLLLMELATISVGKEKLKLQKQWGFEEILPAINLIENSLENAIVPTETELCAVCNVSKATLRRKFNAILGTSVRQYITSYRIQKAVSLLLFTNMSILEIALSIGYQDASGFVKAFMESKGSSPSQCRKEYRKAGDGNRTHVSSLEG